MLTQHDPLRQLSSSKFLLFYLEFRLKAVPAHPHYTPQKAEEKDANSRSARITQHDPVPKGSKLGWDWWVGVEWSLAPEALGLILSGGWAGCLKQTEEKVKNIRLTVSLVSV